MLQALFLIFIASAIDAPDTAVARPVEVEVASATFYDDERVQTAGKPTLTLRAEVINDPVNGNPSKIRGTLRIRDWQSHSGYCLYLPYLDPNYGKRRGTARRFEMFTNRHSTPGFEGGGTTLTAAPPLKIALASTKHVISLELPTGWKADDELELTFESQIPRQPNSDEREWFFDGFHPEPLSACPTNQLEPSEDLFLTSVAAAIDAKIKLPQGWTYSGLGRVDAQTKEVFSRHLSRGMTFRLSKEQELISFQAGTTPVDLHFRSPTFKALQATIEVAIERLEQIFGPYPFPSLTIVESSELQRQAMPGLISVNKPAQTLFDTAQASWLNWQHWVVVMQLANQWYGAAILPETQHDEWLINGIVEFATLEALRQIPVRYNLINADDDGSRLLSFDYLQVHEIQAASLRRYAPFAALTDATFRTRDSYHSQHGLLYIKHANAMRQLAHQTGLTAFYGFLRNLTAAFRYERLNPKEFHNFIDRLPSPFAASTRQELAKSLARWWVDEDWPDFALDVFEQEELRDGRYIAKATAVQEGAIDFAPTIGIKDADGNFYKERATSQVVDGRSVWQAEIITRSRPAEAVIDPDHEAFDADRFNNTSGLPGLTFFPGLANTLRDDAYTVVWAPYAFRRPGEPFSLGLRAAGFRYIQGGLFLKAEIAPSKRLSAFGLRRRYQMPSYAMQADLSFDQDFDNERLSELALVRSPLFGGEPHLSISARARLRERVGQVETRHGTGVLGLSLRPKTNQRACTYNLGFDIERAPRTLSSGFEYERKTSQWLGDCSLGKTRASVGLRIFGGSLWSEGGAPNAALFKPNELREARLRIDAANLERVRKILAAGVDLNFPFYLPLPDDLLILNRQMRWQLYYDVGQSYMPKHIYRAAGLGFMLPFGGDLSGAGSLSLTKLSLLAILYSNVDGIEKRKPSIIFDLTGDL